MVPLGSVPPRGRGVATSAAADSAENLSEVVAKLFRDRCSNFPEGGVGNLRNLLGRRLVPVPRISLGPVLLLRVALGSGGPQLFVSAAMHQLREEKTGLPDYTQSATAHVRGGGKRRGRGRPGRSRRGVGGCPGWIQRI